MIVICAWCGDFLREKEPLEDRTVSHGICPGCSEKATAGCDTPVDEVLGDVPRVPEEMKAG